MEADIRRDLFRHMQELSFDYYDRNRTGQLMSRLTADLFDITELAHHGPEDIFISGVTIVGALIIMFTIQWQLALVIAVIIPHIFPGGLALPEVYAGRLPSRSSSVPPPSMRILNPALSGIPHCQGICQ